MERLSLFYCFHLSLVSLFTFVVSRPFYFFLSLFCFPSILPGAEGLRQNVEGEKMKSDKQIKKREHKGEIYTRFFLCLVFFLPSAEAHLCIRAGDRGPSYLHFPSSVSWGRDPPSVSASLAQPCFPTRCLFGEREKLRGGSSVLLRGGI